ncbi:MAG: S-layer homology domain-containing protein [Clostridia bacterium]|nr:S-layer homology domain-containing protein [Clostridia bacterium]
MKKRIIALAVSCAMLLGSVSALAASSFSDVNQFHAWAEPQIEAMTTLGIIKGYTDGTFRPERAITKTEALVLTARVAGYITEDYSTFKEMAAERYKDVVSAYNTLYPNEVAYLLYKGVLTEEELAGYIAEDRANSPLLRYEMAILLTKLIRADGSINKSGTYTLTYSDAGEIPYTATPYVEYVTNASLMQGIYDPEHPEDIYFKPYDSVTRAQMAVLLYRVLDKFETSVSFGKIVGKNKTNNTITFSNASGTPTIYAVPKDVNLYVDGYETDNVKAIATGADVAFFYINNTLADIEVVNTEDNRWNGVEKEDAVFVPVDPVEGVITTITLSDECSVVVNDVEYTLSAASAIYVNHVASTVYDLRVGYNVKLEFANGKVVVVYATAPSDAYTETVIAEGIVTKLSVTNRQVYLSVTNSETGAVSEKSLYIETGAAIYNGISGEKVDFLALEPADHIIATGTIKDGIIYASKIVIR